MSDILTIINDLGIGVTSYDHDENRIERLYAILDYINKSKYNHYENQLLENINCIHDNKGTITIVWKDGEDERLEEEIKQYWEERDDIFRLFEIVWINFECLESVVLEPIYIAYAESNRIPETLSLKQISEKLLGIWNDEGKPDYICQREMNFQHNDGYSSYGFSSDDSYENNEELRKIIDDELTDMFNDYSSNILKHIKHLKRISEDLKYKKYKHYVDKRHILLHISDFLISTMIFYHCYHPFYYRSIDLESLKIVESITSFSNNSDFKTLAISENLFKGLLDKHATNIRLVVPFKSCMFLLPNDNELGTGWIDIHINHIDLQEQQRLNNNYISRSILYDDLLVLHNPYVVSWCFINNENVYFEDWLYLSPDSDNNTKECLDQVVSKYNKCRLSRDTRKMLISISKLVLNLISYLTEPSQVVYAPQPEAIEPTRKMKASEKLNLKSYTFLDIKPEVIIKKEPVGTHKRPEPHLRRGHYRRQRHGKGLTQEKLVFIPECMVNRDNTN